MSGKPLERTFLRNIWGYFWGQSMKEPLVNILRKPFRKISWRNLLYEHLVEISEGNLCRKSLGLEQTLGKSPRETKERNRQRSLWGSLQTSGKKVIGILGLLRLKPLWKTSSGNLWGYSWGNFRGNLVVMSKTKG